MSIVPSAALQVVGFSTTSCAQSWLRGIAVQSYAGNGGSSSAGPRYTQIEPARFTNGVRRGCASRTAARPQGRAAGDEVVAEHP